MGIFFLWIVVTVWHFEKDTSLETTLKDESYVDVLVGQEIDFKNMDDIIFEDEHYQIISIDTHDAEYYFLECYRKRNRR